jgi:hypothetical protein
MLHYTLDSIIALPKQKTMFCHPKHAGIDSYNPYGPIHIMKNCVFGFWMVILPPQTAQQIACF